MSNSNKRCLLVAFDGMCLSDLEALAGRVPYIRQRLLKGVPGLLDATPLTSPQAIWSEILTGRPWHEAGCSGYCRSGKSLGSREIFRERDLKRTPALLESPEDLYSVTINVPLLEPGRRRIWLSDGSSPAAVAISPPFALPGKAAVYSAMPDLSVAKALSNPKKGLESIFDTERIRLDYAVHLAKTVKWHIFILRISVFDHLAHLLGVNLLTCPEHSANKLLAGFLDYLNNSLQALARHDDQSDVFLLSAYCHEKCVATLNLNQFLSQMKLCRLVPLAGTNETMLERRVSSIQSIGDAGRAELLAVLKRCLFAVDASASRAASPAAGAIHINRRSSFAGGFLNDNEGDCCEQEITEALKNEAARLIGRQPHVWRAGGAGTASGAGIGLNGGLPPDLMVFIPGVEFIDFGEAVWNFNHKPRSTHSPSGFCVIPAGIAREAALPEVMRPHMLTSWLSRH